MTPFSSHIKSSEPHITVVLNFITSDFVTFFERSGENLFTLEPRCSKKSLVKSKESECHYIPALHLQPSKVNFYKVKTVIFLVFS